jgi:hypothetical protein
VHRVGELALRGAFQLSLRPIELAARDAPQALRRGLSRVQTVGLLSLIAGTGELVPRDLATNRRGARERRRGATSASSPAALTTYVSPQSDVLSPSADYPVSA